MAAHASPPSRQFEDLASTPLQVELHENLGSSVVVVTGEMDISSVGEVRQVVYRALRHRPKTLTLDLADLSFCDSTGVHLALHARRKAVALGTRFQLLPPSGPARRVFDLCCVAEYVTVLDGGADTAHP